MDRILCLLIYIITALSSSSKRLARLGIGSYDEWSKGKKLKVLLAGYNGAKNTGSDVRVAAIAKQVKELFGDDVQITVMTLDRDTFEDYFDEGVELFDFTTLFPLALLRACTMNHAVILCEGSTLKSTFANGLTLFLCEAAGIMSRQHKPCIAYGSEVGTMEPFLEKAAKKLCRDTYFITRTAGSLKALKELGLTGHAGTDAAWSYDGAISDDEAERMLRERGWDGKKPLLGIAVIDPFCWPVRASMAKWIKSMVTRNYRGQYDKWYYYSESPARSKAFQKYIEDIAAAAGGFIEKEGYFPVLVGMERLDKKACLALQEKLGRECAVFLSGDTTAGVMTGILRRLSVLVTSRYHAAVLSMEHGCPIIAISMDERLDGIMKELSLDGEYLMHVDDEELADRLGKALDAAVSHSHEISEIILRSMPEYKRTLREMGEFMKNYFLENLK